MKNLPPCDTRRCGKPVPSNLKVVCQPDPEPEMIRWLQTDEGKEWMKISKIVNVYFG